MDLSTTYLGLTLAHPYMVGASPIAGNLDAVKRLEDAGTAAVVLHSLFEEQVTLESRGEIRHRDAADASFAATVAHFPALGRYPLTRNEYLDHIRRVKAAVRVPVIASINGCTAEAWMRVVRDIEQAGADALEVNFYDVVSDPERSSLAVETDLRDMVIELKRALRIPVAIKLSPYFTAFGNLARRLDRAGVDGLIIFNRFYQPDIDIVTMSPVTQVELSTSAELRLRLQWAALLHGQIGASIAVTGGVSTPEDAIKALLAGADAVQVVSAVLREGPSMLERMHARLERYLDEQHFAAVSEIKGRVSLAGTGDPAAFERAAYIRTLHAWNQTASEK